MATPALLPLADALRAVQHVRVRLLPHPPPAHLPLHGHLTRGSRQPRMNSFWDQPAIGIYSAVAERLLYRYITNFAG
jgi:hypothetical protein